MNVFLLTALFASIALSLAIGYLFWTEIRVLRFKADLMEMLVELHGEVAQVGSLHDPAYLRLRDLINNVLLWADRYSLLVVRCYQSAFEAGGLESDQEDPKAQSTTVQHILEEATSAFYKRFHHYLTGESLSGLIGQRWFFASKPEPQGSIRLVTTLPWSALSRTQKGAYR